AKMRAASLSVGYNVVSTLAKLLGAALTNSVSLLGEAVHSATDIVASLFAFFAVRASSAPADEEHPYGHGKMESLAGFGESVLLLGIMVYIASEATKRLVAGAHVVRNLHEGLWIIGMTSAGSMLVGRLVLAAAKRTGSPALRSNGLHLTADFVTSAGVFVALALAHWTPWAEADAVIALVLSGWLGFNAFRVMVDASRQLVDRRLADEDVARLRAILSAEKRILSYHRLRTRLSGSMRHIDFHIVVPRQWSLVEAHGVADELEKRIEAEFAPAKVVVHVDPYDPNRAERRARES
ncbi:MAG: cation transporter, partial [Fimbriimonas ginsengisoli]|nr:cation transporter [Fimbriimonas ginsengisoli]